MKAQESKKKKQKTVDLKWIHQKVELLNIIWAPSKQWWGYTIKDETKMFWFSFIPTLNFLKQTCLKVSCISSNSGSYNLRFHKTSIHQLQMSAVAASTMIDSFIPEDFLAKMMQKSTWDNFLISLKLLGLMKLEQEFNRQQTQVSTCIVTRLG